jgi:MFS family permease
MEENKSETEDKEEEQSGNPRLALVSAAVILVLAAISARSVNNMVVTSLPFLAKYNFGFGNVEVGLISAVLYGSTLVVTTFLNPMLRAATRRKIFIASTAVIPVTMVLFYFSTPVTLWPIAVASGLASGFLFPNIITSASLHKNHMVQMRLLAIYSVSLSTSLVIGPSLETWLLTFLTYKQIFLPFMGLSIVGFVVSPFVKFPKVKKEVKGGRAALGNKGLLTSLISITIYNVPFAAITSFLVIFAVERFGVSSSTAYSVFIFFFAVSFITRLSMAIRPFKALFIPLLVSSVITIGSLLALPFMSTFTVFIILMAVLGIPHGSIFPISSMLIARGTTPEERSVANSYFMAYNNVLFIVVPVVFGFLSLHIGFQDSFTILGGIAFTATVVVFMMYARNKSIFNR